MKTTSFFKPLEKQSFHLYFQDGIFEMLFGFLFLIFVFNSSSYNMGKENSLFVRLLMVPISFILALLKIFLTQPRIGLVKFSKRRRKKQTWVLIVAVIAQIIPLIAYILSAKGILQSEQKNHFLPLFIEFMFFILVFSLISYFTEYPVFFIVGLVFALGIPLTIYLQPWLKSRDYGYGLMAVTGLVLLVYGVYKMVLFLKMYPRVTSNEQ